MSRRSPRVGWVAVACLAVGLGAAAVSAEVQPRSPMEAEAEATGYGAMPLVFVPNHGQHHDQVAFSVQGSRSSVFFSASGLTYVLEAPPTVGATSARLDSDAAHRRWAVALDFVGARPELRPESLAEAATVVSYFTGPPQQWRTGLRTSSRIIYRELWPGIDLVFSGSVNHLKHEFIVRPGADPQAIRLAYRGADRVALDGAGRLEVTTPFGSFADDVPIAWQEDGGAKDEVAVAYLLGEGHGPRDEVGSNAQPGALRAVVAGEQAPVYGFDVGAYDRSRTLVIDPVVLVYSGFIGSTSVDHANDIAVDGAGSAYVVGYTSSDGFGFPLAVGPDLSHGGGHDAFIAKVDPTGSALEYCGYIGGSGDDEAEGVAVDAAGNAYVVGVTDSGTTFPRIIGPSLTPSGLDEAFVVKVNAAGTGLLYSGFIGGSADDSAEAVAVGSSGTAYVTGVTLSTNLPTSGGPDLSYNGAGDAFVAVVNSLGSGLVSCGYLGGSGGDYGYGIAVDGQNRAHLTGRTASADFPRVVGPDLSYNGGGFDAFVTRLDDDASSIEYSGYYGGAALDEGHGIALDSAGRAYLAGVWGADAFVARINAGGTEDVGYGGTIGGSDSDWAADVAVDRLGQASIVGTTSSANFPVVDAPGSYGGFHDAFIVRLNAAGTNFLNSGCLGGSLEDYGNGIAVDTWGNAYVAGRTNSSQSSFPVLGGPDLTQQGSTDAFVAKIQDSAFVFADGFEEASTSAWDSAVP